MRVAVDAMGGDFAPAEVVKGALTVAADQPGTTVILVGDEPLITAELAKFPAVPSNVTIRHTSEVIAMHEHPAQAIRKKRDSSLVVAGRMVKTGEADATMSAGNTGAAMAIATLEIGRIPGIDRPAIGATLPTINGRFLLVDAGANVDCTVDNLIQFAIVGSIYADKVMRVKNPRVGLLNIGGEAGKGNELAKETYTRLQSLPINFVGNVEGKDAFEGAADVVVCDGFAGNVLLKSGEGVAEMIIHALQTELGSLDDATRNAFMPAFKRLKNRIDYAETGGAPLLGVDGVSIIAHGRSHGQAIASAMRVAIVAAESKFVGAIRETLTEVSGSSE